MPGPIDPASPSLRPTDGWKLHLGAAPEHHAAIEGELQGMVARGEVAHYKRGLGAGQAGKDFTVYAGHRDAAAAAAGSLHARVGHLLSPPGADVLADDLPLAGHVHGRFDVGASDPAFHQYGSRGVPYHAEDMGNLTFAPPAERPGLADAARTRAHASLAAKYGDFYSGSPKAPTTPAMGPLDWQALKRFVGDESGALKIPLGGGGPPGGDFASQLNLSDQSPVKRAFAIGAHHNVPTRTFDGDNMRDLAKLWGIEPNRALSIPAFYGHGGGIGLNLAGAPWDDSAAMAGQVRGLGDMFHFSSTHPDHYIHHELGHALHDRLEPDAFTGRLKSPFPASDQRFLAANVSQYGSKSPQEAVAEIYAGLAGGQKFQPGVRDALRKYGGQNLYDYMGDNRLLKFLGDESGALKIPTGGGGAMPDDFASQQNMGDSYRLGRGTGVPKGKSTPPPIGGPEVTPGGGAYRMKPGPAPRGVPAQVPEADPMSVSRGETNARIDRMIPRTPATPMSSSPPGDLRAAMLNRTSGLRPPANPASLDPLRQAFSEHYPAEAAIPPPAPGPVLPRSPLRQPGVTPEAYNQIHKQWLTKLMEEEGGFANPAAIGGGLRRLAPAAGALAGPTAFGLAAQAVNHPEEAVDAAVHPIQTAGAVGAAVAALPGQAYRGLTDPQGTWAPDFTQGLTRIMSGDVTAPEAWDAFSNHTLPGSVAKAGLRIGGQLHKHLANFGTGYTADTLGRGLGVIGNKISDAWHDPGGGFDR